jgi:hypothetical protein
VPRDQLVQLRHERGVSAQGEIRADSVLDSEESQVFEMGKLVLNERLGGEVCERRTTPQREGFS